MLNIITLECKKIYSIKRSIFIVVFRYIFLLVFLGIGVHSNFSYEGNYYVYILPGINVFMIFGLALIFMNQLYFEKASGLYKLYYFSNQGLYKSLYLIKVLIYSIASIGFSALLVVCTIILGGSFSVHFIIKLIGLSFLLSIIIILLLTAILSVLKNNKKFQNITNFLLFPLLMLSGAMFNIDNFPSWIKFFSLFNPLYYITEALRNYVVEDFIDLKFTLVIFIMFIISIYIIKKQLNKYLV